MAGPGCPKDGSKAVQDGVKVVHEQLLWEIWATPSCYKVLHWPMVHDAKCECGSVRLYVHKTEALRASGPHFFLNKAKNRKKATTTHQEHQKKIPEHHLRTRSTATGRQSLLAFLQPLPKQIASVLQSLLLLLRQTFQPVWERTAKL